MTGIVSYCDDKCAIIAMDTLSIDKDTHEPYKIVTKIFPILNAKTIICGTGDFVIPQELFVFVNEKIISQDIDSTVRYLSKTKNDFYDYISSKYGRPLSGTIYLFGYSNNNKSYKIFKIKFDENNISIEELEYGLMIKPPDGIIQNIENYLEEEKDIYLTICKCLCEMKTIDDMKPIEQRVGIGGQITLLSMSSNGYRFEVFEFPNYSSLYQKCLSNNGNQP